MDAPHYYSSDSQSWYSKIAMIATLPLLPLVLVYFGISAYTEVYLYERRVRVRMQRVRRYLSQNEACLQMNEHGGTLIIENIPSRVSLQCKSVAATLTERRHNQAMNVRAGNDLMISGAGSRLGNS